LSGLHYCISASTGDEEASSIEQSKAIIIIAGLLCASVIVAAGVVVVVFRLWTRHTVKGLLAYLPTQSIPKKR